MTTSELIEQGKVAAQRWAATAGARLLDELLSTIKSYVVFPDEHAAVSVALWIATTHALPAFECAPRLLITSPGKRCGKTRLLDMVEGTCHRPLASANATVAAIFRSIGDKHPRTLLIDEADTLFGSKKVAEQNEDLRALLNAGHQRGRPALRCVGPNQVPTEFPTFAMAALAGIGDMPDTIVDRSVNVALRRRTRDEKVSKFRARRDGTILENLRDQLAAWTAENLDALSAAEPPMPVEDRAADTWEPLIAVADVAGGHWPATARAACTALVNQAGETDESQSLAVKLLADIKAIFAERCSPFLPSTDLVCELRRIEESPWNDFELTPSKLAFRLKPFGIKPQRNTVGSVRGYSLEGLSDVFTRYLRQDPSDRQETASEQQQPSDTQNLSDTLTRQTQITRQDVIPAQTMFTDDLTGPDTPPAETATVCRYCGTELRLSAAATRGYCSRAACLSAHRNQSPANPKACQRCNVSLPLAATGPLCDECTDTPERPIPPRSTTTDPATTVVHNGTMTTDTTVAFSPGDWAQATRQT